MLSLSSLYLPAVFIQCLIFVAENAEGKYISPFHDIPMYADEGQVSHLYPVAYVNMRAFIRSALKINFPCSTGSDVQLLFFFCSSEPIIDLQGSGLYSMFSVLCQYLL